MLLPEPDSPLTRMSCTYFSPSLSLQSSCRFCRARNSAVESTPRSLRMWLRTAASTSTARLRPAATGMMTLRTVTPSMSSHRSASGRRSPGSRPSGRGFSRCAISLSFIFGRTAVSPKMVRMLSSPRPLTSRKSLSIGGQRPSSVLAAMREISTMSSATRPCPRLMSSRPSSLLPTPDSPVISTPRPSTSMKTPCRSAVPPSRPAIQASDNASRLSSCSRATLTCSIRLPRRDQLVKGTGVRRPAHRLAQRLVAEHLRELGKDLQVLLGRLFGNQQHEYQADRIAVGGVERHRLREPQERAQRLLQPLDAAVRNRYPLAEPGRAEALAREQAVEDQAAGEAVMVLEQQAGLL